MKTLFKTTLITAATCLLASGALADGLTLKSALISAYKNSDQLQISRANLRRTDEAVAQQRANNDFNLSGQASQSTSRNFNNGTTTTTGTISATGSKVIWDGGENDALVEAARLDVLAARQGLIDTEQTVFLNAVTAFIDVRRDRDSVALAKNNVRVLREQVRAARDRFEVGEVTRTDVSQTEARLASAISSQATSEGNLRGTEQAFIAAIGARPGHLHMPKSTPKLPSSVRKAEALGVKRHPRVLQAQFQVKAAEERLRATTLNKKPEVSLSLTGQTSPTGLQEDTSLTARIQADLPLYQGGRLNSLRRSALAQLESAKSQVQLNAAITRQNVSTAYAQWQSSIAAIKSVRTQIRSAQIAFDGVQEEAKLGARTTLDALDAEQELLNARSNLIQASRNEFIAAYSVLSEMGLLTVKNLKLGIKEYNPDVNYSKATAKSKLGTKRINLLEKLQKR